MKQHLFRLRQGNHYSEQTRMMSIDESAIRNRDLRLRFIRDKEDDPEARLERWEKDRSLMRYRITIEGPDTHHQIDTRLALSIQEMRSIIAIEQQEGSLPAGAVTVTPIKSRRP